MKPGLLFLFCFILFVSCDDNTASPDISESNTIDCIFVSEPPSHFPGGIAALNTFIDKNLVVPARICAEGRVFVGFVVEKDGTISDIKIIRGVSQQHDLNAIEVVKKMPRWLPGKDINGNLTRTRMTLPIKFSL
jgi:periplasmic protein TonB